MPKPPITTFSSVLVTKSESSANNGLYAPRLTSDQIAAIPLDLLRNGAIVYNTTEDKFQIYQRNSWEDFDPTNYVIGPDAAVENNIAIFGDTPKKITDSGVTINRVPALPFVLKKKKNKKNPLVDVNEISNIGHIRFNNSGGIGTIYVDTLSPVHFVENNYSGSNYQISSVFTGGLPTASTSVSALLEIQTTTGALLLSRLTTTQIGALTNPIKGMLLYDATNDQFKGYIGASNPYLSTIFTSDNNGDLDIQNHYINNVNDPVLPQQAATKNYVDVLASGFVFEPTVIAASTNNINANYNNGNNGVGATLTNNGSLTAFSLDGILLTTSNRVLIKNQSLAFQNGIYIVTTVGNNTTPWILTRASNYDQPLEIKPGELVPVQNGTVNTSTVWLQTAVVNVIGTDNINYIQFSYSPSYFLQVANNLSDLSNIVTARNNLGLTNIAIQNVIEYNVLVGGASNTITSIPLLNGQLLIGSTGANPVATIPTNGTNITWTTGAGSLTANLTGQVALANGGTGANLTANNGGIVYSTASALAILGGTITANQVLLSGSSSAPSWSAATYPASTTVNQLLYSSNNNVISGLATANNGVLVTNGTGVPSISSTLPTQVQGNITSLGIIGSGTWNGSTIQVQFGGTGITTVTPYGILCGGTTSTGALQSLASLGTSGQVLTSQGPSALPIWSSLSTSAVTSITGTANQILANNTTGSAQTGAITLTLPQSIATTSNVQFGSIGINTSSVSNAKLISNSDVAYNILLQGTQTTTSITLYDNNNVLASPNYQAAIKITSTFAPTPTIEGYIAGIINTPTITIPNVTNPAIAAVYGEYISLAINGTVGKVLTNCYGIYVGSGNLSTASVTNAYGGYFSTPSFGSASAIALYTDNISVGYPNIAIPTNSIVIKNQLAIGITSPNAGSIIHIRNSINNQYSYGILGQNIFNPSTGAIEQFQFAAIAEFGAPSGQTISRIAGMYVYNYFTSNVGTITNAYGILVDGGSSLSGTITNHYSGYFSNPSTGTNKTALYTDNLSIGYTNITPPSNGMAISGNVAIGVTSSSYPLTVIGRTLLNGTVGIGTNPSSVIQLAIASSLTANAGGLYGTYSWVTFGATANNTLSSATGLYVNPDMSGNASTGTITNAYGVFCDQGVSSSGTITNAYGGYFRRPLVGTNKTALYSDNLSIGYVGANLTSIPTDGAIISGNVGIGTSTPSSSYKLHVNGDMYSSGIFMPTTGGTATRLDYYEEYSLSSSIGWTANGGWAGGTISGGIINIIRIGKTVIFMLKSALTFTLSSADWIYTYNLPARFKPSQFMAFNVPSVYKSDSPNAGTSTGYFAYNTAGYLAFFFTNSASFAAGSWTIWPFSVSWTIQ